MSKLTWTKYGRITRQDKAASDYYRHLTKAYGLEEADKRYKEFIYQSTHTYDKPRRS